MKFSPFITIPLFISAILFESCNSSDSIRENPIRPTTDSAINNSPAGNEPVEIRIGNQIWSTKNLRTTHFNNGDLIPEAASANDWKKAGEAGKPAWCYYNNDTTNGEKYGRLYNWFAVNDKRGLAPKGWHVASDEEWKKLVEQLGGMEVAGTKLKSTLGWKENGNGNNMSGFSAVPGGYRYKNGEFNAIDYFTCFWTSSESYTYSAWFRSIRYDDGGVYRSNFGKQDGYSVRCLKE